MKAIRLYAQVLVDVVSAPGAETNLASAVKELESFGAMSKESALVLKIFDNPTMSDDDKQKVLKELVSKTKLSALTARFLSILTKRSRLGLLPEILREVEVIQLEKTGGLMGVLTSAVPLEAGVATSVAQALSKKLNKPVQLKEEVDPGVIAGMRVTIGGTTYDGSVRGKLDKLAAGFQS